MSVTIQLNTEATIQDNGQKYGGNNSAFYQITSSLYTVAPQLIPSTGFVQLSASLLKYDWIRFINNDETSSIIICSDASGSNILSVIPPQPRPASILQGLTSSFYAKATPSASFINVMGSPV